MRMIIKVIGVILLLFLVSVIAVNLIRPALHAKAGTTCKESVAESEYEASSAGDERILCIDDNEEALLWRLRMIGNAKESIVLSTFDLRLDESGSDVVAALFMAAERGVKVRLLIDGIYQILYLDDNASFQALCAHENIEVRFYNPVNLKNIYKVNYRMHDKYLMVDDKMYMFGGRNTCDIFLGNARKDINIDRDIFVYHTEPGEGESFQELKEYFQQIWVQPCVREAKSSCKRSISESEYALFRQRYENLRKSYGDFEQFDGWEEATIEANKITLLSNGTQAANKEPKLLYALEQLTLGSEEVLIQTPYVICDEAMYDVLENIEETSEVKIILNAVARGSNPWGCTDYLNNKEKILDTGVDVYELMNEHAVHTKTVLIDDNISVVGSYNLDMRSTYLDTELMLVIDSKELNTHIREMTEEYKEKSIEVLSDGTETKGRLYYEAELPNKKKMFYRILRVVIRPFRHLL